ncbi:unnamed protein product [Rotaria sp. Silwood2]|nr:unnamed protein product [Rotaria sp. Silwood2]CAF4430544.1 unnamed protein product [Rotaria sp. Silwood2]
MDVIQRILQEVGDINNRLVVCKGKLNEMLTPQVQQQQEQQQNHDIQRNYLVIQTIRTKIALLMSKRNLLEYDEQEIRKLQTKNAGDGAGNAGGGAEYAGVGDGNTSGD